MYVSTEPRASGDVQPVRRQQRDFTGATCKVPRGQEGRDKVVRAAGVVDGVS